MSDPLDFTCKGSVGVATSTGRDIMGNRSPRQSAVPSDAALRGVLDQMEPDLKLLEGVVAVLRALSATDDAVEPMAIEAMAYLAGETVDRVSALWREASEQARQL